jgi:hypothetical protein
MPREWISQALASAPPFKEAGQFYLRPSLDADKFPDEHRIVLPPELAAQEREGHLMF